MNKLKNGGAIKLVEPSKEIGESYLKKAENKEDELDDCIDSLKMHTGAKSNYAGFARYFYKTQGLGQYIND